MNDREKRTVSKMIAIYCKKKHPDEKTLCNDCLVLENYAHKRLENCMYGIHKPSCKQCPTHCYKVGMREYIQEVMRYAGPRMILYHPIAAIVHFYYEWKNKKRFLY